MEPLKVATSITTSSSAGEVADDVKTWGEATDLVIDCDRCDQFAAQFESSGSIAHSTVLWLLPATKALTLSKHGCRVIQKAIDLAASGERILLVNELKGSVEDLYKSPWGNHVLMKLIEVMPPTSLAFLITELAGKAVVAARHQYGCRIFERLIEHFPAEQIVSLVDEILLEAEPLCRHPFGNFVMQHLFEYGSQTCKDIIVQQIIPALPKLAKHRTASHVVQRGIEFCSASAHYAIVSALIHGEGDDALVEIACTRYGSYVVHELASVQVCKERVRDILQDHLPRLALDRYGKRSLAGFGLAVTAQDM
jgi:mRNA-binding protein PUF3